MNRIIEFLVCCMFFQHIALSQIPANDPHWKLDWQDDFNTFNNLRWSKGNYGIQDKDAKCLYMAQNVWTANGNLVIEMNNTKTKCPIEPQPWPGAPVANCINGNDYDYTSGIVATLDNVQFGYIESRIKAPFKKGWNLCSAFWTFIGWNVPPPKNAAEIDIFEMFGERYKEPNTINTCIHRYYNCTNLNNPLCDPKLAKLDRGLGISHEFSNFDYTDWHIYAIEWNADRIIWYVDGKVIRTMSDHKIINPVMIILSNAMDKKPSPSFSEKMLVDYVKVYKLKCDKEETPVNEISNFNTYNYTVKKSITMSNATTIPANSNITLRATDFIELKPGFEVQTGRELYLDVTPCDNSLTGTPPPEED